MYADVLFPLKLPPLTYRIPGEMRHDIMGAVVKAPLMGRDAYGLVVNVSAEADPSLKRALKEIRSIHGTFASAQALQFLKWLSEYYITPMGIALKSSFFEEAAASFDGRSSARAISSRRGKPAPFPAFTEASASEIGHPEILNLAAHADCVGRALGKKRYGAFLLPTPYVYYEYSFLADILRKIKDEVKGIIILVPEIGHIPRLEALIRPLVGKRLCLLHSKLGKARRVETIRTILSSETDVVLGTRSAVLAPLVKASFIAVTGEHSVSYKGEERLRYQGRDVAVMRAFMDKACIVLSSICPSVESIYNARIGKYVLLRGGDGKECKSEKAGRWIELERPTIKIMDLKPGRRGTPSLSDELVKQARGVIAGGERLLFLINRKGYSLIRCSDCGYTTVCGKCGTLLVFHKSEGKARCRRCGTSEPVVTMCPRCGGVAVSLPGAGTERIKEEVKEIFNREAVVLEKGPARVKTAELDPDALSLGKDTEPLVIGTAYARRLEYAVGEEAFGAAAFLNMDMLLAQPDFRAYERAFQEVMQAAQMVKPGGALYLQTRMPKNRVVRFIRNYDLDGFYDYELDQRKSMNYPPFSRIVLITAQGKDQSAMADVRRKMEAVVVLDVEPWGPAEIPCPSKGYVHCLQLLLKSRDRKALHSATAELLNELGGIKGISVRADVDPLVL